MLGKCLLPALILATAWAAATPARAQGAAPENEDRAPAPAADEAPAGDETPADPAVRPDLVEGRTDETPADTPDEDAAPAADEDAEATVPADVEAEAATIPADESRPFFSAAASGSFAARYRLRWATDRDLDPRSDQDLDEYLAADLGDEQSDALTAHLFGRATQDLDGNSRRANGWSPFDSPDDTYRAANARLFALHLDYHRLDPVETVRLGRQYLEETPVPFHFDGLRLETREIEVTGKVAASAGAYGGIPVHPFESAIRGDALAGGFAQARPLPYTRLRADYSHVRDRYLYGSETDGFWAFSAWQDLGERLRLHYRHTLQDGRGRDLLASARWADAEGDLHAEVSYFRQLGTRRIETIEFEQLFAAAQSYHGYQQYRVLAGKGLGDYVLIDGGFELRELNNERDEAPFNREFRRYFLSPSLTDWPLEGLGLSATGELWDVPGTRDGDYRSGGVDLDYRASDALRLSAGTAFALYKWDLLTNQERAAVRTSSVRVEWRPWEPLRLRAGFELERSDLLTLRTLTVGATYEF